MEVNYLFLFFQDTWRMAVPGGRVAALDDPVGLSDMCLLEPLTEDNFLTNLHQRFKHDLIYVSSLPFHLKWQLPYK